MTTESTATTSAPATAAKKPAKRKAKSARKPAKRKMAKPGKGKLTKAGKTSLVIWVDAKQGAFVKRLAKKAGVSQADFFRKKLGIPTSKK